MKQNISLAFIIVAILFCDQSTKWLASQYLVYAQPVEILPIFDLRLLHNSGAAFSLLADLGWQRWFLVVVSFIASIVLFYLLFFSSSTNTAQRIAVMLLLAGAVGNLIDRFFFGYVIDFISLHYAEYYFPTFNVADAAISIGATFWIAEMIFARKQGQR